MVNLRCAKCSAEIVPGTSFCRSCGAPVEPGREPSEMQTAMLDESAARQTTRRFEARTTAEAGAVIPVGPYQPAPPAIAPLPTPLDQRRPRGGLVIVVIILVALLAGGGLIGVMKRVRHSGTQMLVNQKFYYPGAKTVVNVGSESGAALQMETTDPIDKAAAWYETTLKPTKTLRVTGDVLIMKNDTVTATLASTNQGTSIVIKQLAP